jgi:hypothetical protein
LCLTEHFVATEHLLIEWSEILDENLNKE